MLPWTCTLFQTEVIAQRLKYIPVQCMGNLRSLHPWYIGFDLSQCHNDNFTSPIKARCEFLQGPIDGSCRRIMGREKEAAVPNCDNTVIDSDTSRGKLLLHGEVRKLLNSAWAMSQFNVGCQDVNYQRVCRGYSGDSENCSFGPWIEVGLAHSVRLLQIEATSEAEIESSFFATYNWMTHWLGPKSWHDVYKFQAEMVVVWNKDAGL